MRLAWQNLEKQLGTLILDVFSVFSQLILH